jgi:hypothetical protein
MIYIIILLLISHIAALYFINKYIAAYKLNNHNYINGELQKIKDIFLKAASNIDHNVSALQQKNTVSFEKLESENKGFIKAHKTNFKDVTNFIKNDYTSLTESLSTNNNLLSQLLEKTENNITKNAELKPILVNSSKELEKVYGKIKQLITTYEKSLNDIKTEMEDVLYKVETTIDGKIKQLAASGEKTLRDSIENSKTTIAQITDETNKGLKNVLKENQIKLLTDKVENLNTVFNKNFDTVLTSVNELDKVFLKTLKEQKDKDGDKKGFFNF